MSDEQLMLNYADGDSAAFEVLYARYRGPLYRYILRQVSDATTANDLYQGSWEKMIKARHRYPSQAPFRAWLFRIARNHVIDHFRRQRPEVPLDPESQADPDDPPGEALDRDASRRRLRAAIAALPQEQRDTLLLKLEAGLGLEEIGTLTGVGRETVKSRLRYAVARLKQVLEP